MIEKPRVGVRLASLNTDFRDALDMAAKLSLAGVRLDVGGAIDPKSLTGTGRREVASLLRGRALEGLALGSSLRQTLDEPEHQEERLNRIGEIFKLAVDLHVKAVVLYSGNPNRPPGAEESKDAEGGAPAGKSILLGLSPLMGGILTPSKPKNDPQRRFQSLLDSLDFVARLAERTGVVPMIDPAGNSVLDLSDLLRELDHAGCGLHWDPATQLASGMRPLTFLQDPARLVERPVVVAGRDWLRNLAVECIPGQGDLDWPELMMQMAAAGFSGAIIADRTSGNQPARELLIGARALTGMIP